MRRRIRSCAVRIEIPLRPVLNSNEREPRKRANEKEACGASVHAKRVAMVFAGAIAAASPR